MVRGQGRRAASSRAARRPLLRRALALSLLIHLLLVVPVLIVLDGRGVSVAPDDVFEVAWVRPSPGRRPGTSAARRAPSTEGVRADGRQRRLPPRRQHRQDAPAAAGSSSGLPAKLSPRPREARAGARADGSASLPLQRDPEQAPCLLRMRGDCAAVGGQPAGRRRLARQLERDRLVTLRRTDAERDDDEGTKIAARVSHDGLEMTRYHDGGRLLRSDGRRQRAPGLGEAGLLALSTAPLGISSGKQLCNPYRHVPRGEQRLLVLMVDTSGSVVQARRAPAALVCAAGAALSALERGHRVALVNFSTQTRFLRPTRDMSAIYSVMSDLQGEGTRLPAIASLDIPAAPPKDYVLVTDAAIANLARVLPDYGRALRAQRDNRGLLYLLGQGQHAQAAGIRRVGFVADQVEQQDDRLFARYALQTLRSLLLP